ncbi:MAG TPA: UbiA family prenyltransferase [Thermoanaerobaculia bacterium]
MSDPVLCIVVYAVFLAAMAAAHFFKTLDTDLGAAWRTALALGVAVAFVLFLVRALYPVIGGIALTLAALYVRHTGRETEAVDGMLVGSVIGATAAIPFVMTSVHEAGIIASLMLAGAVAGFGITFAVFHVADKRKQIAFDVATAAAAIVVAWLPSLAVRYGIRERHILIAVAAALPLIVVGAVFQQWPDVRAELRHESSLGFMNDRDVRATAHPLLRLGRGGWADRRAHREFVRLANRIALRKRQQRNRTDDEARLYQIEIIKLRMQIQEMSHIDRAVFIAGAEDEESSDTMTKTHEG